jgi:drug/metabolite transporter (DMT)-like permease
MDWTNLIFLGAALCWASLTYLSQFAQKKMDPFVYNPLLYLLAAGLSFLIQPDKWLETSAGFPLSVWLNVLYLAIGAGSAGAGVYFFAAKKLGAAKASTMTFLVPVLALFLGWLLLHEQIQWQTLLGGSLSILAVLIIHGRIRIRLFQTSC